MDDASSGCSSLSARTGGSAMSVGGASTSSYHSRTLPRPSSSRGTDSGGGGGGMEEEDFLKAFADIPSVTVSTHNLSPAWGQRSCVSFPFQIYTSHDLDKIMARLQATLVDGSKPWEQRVSAVRTTLTLSLTHSLTDMVV